SNIYYKIENQFNKKLVTSNLNVNKIFIHSKNNDNLSQQWIFFSVDGEKFIITNRATGKVISVNICSRHPNNLQISPFIPGSPNQQWIIETLDNNYYKIRNSSNGKVATISAGAKNPNNMFVYNDIPNASNQQWVPLITEKFNLPQMPKLENLDPVPQYTNATHILPESTFQRLVAWTLIPCIMINDNNWSDATKINTSPYYILEKYQYWTRLENLSLAPGESTHSSYTYGITTRTQISLKNTFGFSIGKDGGINFKEDQVGMTRDLKMQFHDELKMAISTSTEDMTSTTQTHDQENPFNTTLTYAKYILATRFVLKRVASNSNDKNTDVNFWDYTDGHNIYTVIH
ncbi:RICIN domain-containing protein, partial [Bacillus cereus]|nr:RICIN domain-containing protein [Bacillus cereus]